MPILGEMSRRYWRNRKWLLRMGADGVEGSYRSVWVNGSKVREMRMGPLRVYLDGSVVGDNLSVDELLEKGVPEVVADEE